MIIRRLSLLELNTLVEHPLKNDITISGNELSVLVENTDGKEYRLSATMEDGMIVDIHYDIDHLHPAAVDEFRSYLSEMEELYTEMMNILDPMPDNDNKTLV